MILKKKIERITDLGDRGGIVIYYEDGWVFLYTHWNSRGLLSDVKKGIKKMHEDHVTIRDGAKQAVYIFVEMLNRGLHGLEIMGYSPPGGYGMKEVLKDAAEDGILIIGLQILIVIESSEIAIFDYINRTFIKTTLTEFVSGLYTAENFKKSKAYQKILKADLDT